MKVCRNSSFLRKFKYILSGSFLRILFHSFIHLYVSYFPVIGLSTFPSFLKLLCITYNIAINLIPKINCSVTKPLLEVRKLYPLSCVSFIFLQLCGDIPRLPRFTQSFVSKWSNYHLHSSQFIQISLTPAVRPGFNHFVVCHIV